MEGLRRLCLLCVGAANSGLLRLKGRNVVENKFVKMGAYHTIDLELNSKFVLAKQDWDIIAIDRIEKACNPVRVRAASQFWFFFLLVKLFVLLFFSLFFFFRLPDRRGCRRGDAGGPGQRVPHHRQHDDSADED